MPTSFAQASICLRFILWRTDDYRNMRHLDHQDVPSSNVRGFSTVDLEVGGILITQVTYVVPYPAQGVSQVESGFLGTSHTLDGRFAKSPASPNSGPL